MQLYYVLIQVLKYSAAKTANKNSQNITVNDAIRSHSLSNLSWWDVHVAAPNKTTHTVQIKIFTA